MHEGTLPLAAEQDAVSSPIPEAQQTLWGGTCLLSTCGCRVVGSSVDLGRVFFRPLGGWVGGWLVVGGWVGGWVGACPVSVLCFCVKSALGRGLLPVTLSKHGANDLKWFHHLSEFFWSCSELQSMFVLNSLPQYPGRFFVILVAKECVEYE